MEGLAEAQGASGEMILALGRYISIAPLQAEGKEPPRMIVKGPLIIRARPTMEAHRK